MLRVDKGLNCCDRDTDSQSLYLTSDEQLTSTSTTLTFILPVCESGSKFELFISVNLDKLARSIAQYLPPEHPPHNQLNSALLE